MGQHLTLNLGAVWLQVFVAFDVHGLASLASTCRRAKERLYAAEYKFVWIRSAPPDLKRIIGLLPLVSLQRLAVLWPREFERFECARTAHGWLRFNPRLDDRWVSVLLWCLEGNDVVPLLILCVKRQRLDWVVRVCAHGELGPSSLSRAQTKLVFTHARGNRELIDFLTRRFTPNRGLLCSLDLA